MIEKGLIVSIQGYSRGTTQELAEGAVQGGAVAIRTDQPISTKVPVIGLEKIPNKSYYITTSRDSIIRCMAWSNYIAIDSRRGNNDLEILLAHCHINNINVVADIRTLDDVKNLLTICEEQNIRKPAYIATTFDYDMSYIQKLVIIKAIKSYSDIPVIAEGGYSKLDEVKGVLKLCDNVCIGASVSDIEKLTKKYAGGKNVDCEPASMR